MTAHQPGEPDLTGGFAAPLVVDDLRLVDGAAGEAGVGTAVGRRATGRREWAAFPEKRPALFSRPEHPGAAPDRP
ncbi:hypothetical protein [Pseudonocardia sp. ICBG1034]|uniref:hypothetical protein n=1 Tax=Pseudonocardia sp. ICBG1034 TaxID=2844381 RepID=UPI001CCB688C|nr:hypothetical protein [Pseudonocardia sp. ICBG1034]